MRLITKYIALFVALIAVGCSDSYDQTSGQSSEGEGLLTISATLSQTRSESTDVTLEDLLESSLMKIYNSEGGLVRRYTSLTESITDYFAVGDYSITFVAGDFTPATFDESDKSFSGESGVVTISSNTTTEVNIDALLQSTTISISYQSEGIEDHYSEYYVVVSATNSEDDITDETPQLKYEVDDDGYFILPEGVTNLVWQFWGDGEIVTCGVLENVEKRHQYKLSYSYTDYMNVGTIKVTVEDQTEDYDDSFDFKVQPVIKAIDFNLSEYQEKGSYQLSISSLTPVSTITVTAGDSQHIISVADDSLNSDLLEYDSEQGVLTLSSGVFDYIVDSGAYSVDVSVVDSNGSLGAVRMLIGVDGFTSVEDVDFWSKSSLFTGFTLSEDLANVKMRYRFKGATEWTEFAASSTDNHTWSAQVGCEWTTSKNDAGLTVSTFEGGMIPSQEYECQMIADGYESDIFEYTTDATTQTIPDGDLNSSSLTCYASTDSKTDNNAEFWSSGNNSYTSSLCSFYSSGDLSCAYLKAKTADYVVISVFAAGNLYTGTFYMGSTSGTANFGQKYDWDARPKSLNFSYKASVGSSDKCRVYFAIVDWTARRGVTVTTSSSESNPPDGYWDPCAESSVSEGKIIGYGSYLIDSSGTAMTEYAMPIYYYDTESKPSADNYSIVISATTSYKGDYASGSDDSALYIDDFKFEY